MSMFPVIFNDADEINISIKRNISNVVVTYTEVFTGDYKERKSRFDVTMSILKLALKTMPDTINVELVESQCNKENTKYVIRLTGKPEHVMLGVINELLLFLIDSVKNDGFKKQKEVSEWEN